MQAQLMEFRNVTTALPVLCGLIMKGGEIIKSRNGDTMEVRNVHITLTNPLEREVELLGRNASLAAQVAESMWLLAGRNDVAWLSRYLPRAPEFSDDGETWRGAYGPRLRAWHGKVDQLAHVVQLLVDDPATRRAVVQLYDPEIDTAPGKDIPCNNWLHFLSRHGVLDLHVAIRSNDLIWGWSGINAFEWSVLLEVVAKLTGLTVGKLHFSISSLHIYEKHWEKASVLAQTNPPTHFHLGPRFRGTTNGVTGLDSMLRSWFVTEELIHAGEPVHPNDFQDPMFQSWLETVASVEESKAVPQPPPEREGFDKYVTMLHREKHNAYGDSWKRRGEMLAILANIARKVDRLATGTNTIDETQLDTAIDLLVYLAKYRLWLCEEAGAPLPDALSYLDVEADEVCLTGNAESANVLIVRTVPARSGASALEQFTTLEEAVIRNDPNRWKFVDQMLADASHYARYQWNGRAST